MSGPTWVDPPRVSRWVLRRVIPARERDVVLGELDELFRERVEWTGSRRARWWYRRQVAGFVARGVRIRRDERERVAGGTRMSVWGELRGDLRWALRATVGRPVHAGMVVVTMALGVAAVSAVFALANAHFFVPLPYDDPEELVLLWETTRETGEVMTVSPGNYHAWRDETASFQDVAAFNVAFATLSGDGAAEQVTASVVTPHFFDVLGVRPTLGAGFTEDEARLADGRLVLLSHGLWTRRYAADPSIVGSEIRVDGAPHTVVGVLPPEYRQPERRLVWQRTELWRPLMLEGLRTDFDSRYLRTVARRRPGTTLEEARAEMTTLAARLTDAHPLANAGRGVQVRRLPEYLMGENRPVLWLLLAAGSAVLLLVCANVANLTLARGEGRRRDFAVRAALGSGGARLARQVLLEGLILAGAGAATGLLLVALLRDALQGIQERYFSGLVEVTLDARVILATVGVGLLAGLLASLPLGSVAVRTDLRAALTEGSARSGSGARRGRTRSLLVAGQVGFATSLVLVAVLLARSFGQLVAVDPGFRARGVLTVPVSAPAVRYGGRAEVEGFFRETWRSLESIAGVRDVGFVSDLPFTGENRWADLFVEDPPRSGQARPRSEYRVVFPEYFDVMGIPVLAGALPVSRWESPPTNPVIVNRSFAERSWPGGSALGRTFAVELGDTVELTVAAVVGNVRDDGFEGALEPLFYLPWATRPTRSMHAMIRVEGDPGPVSTEIRDALARIDPEMPVGELRPLSQLMADTVARPRAASLLGAVFALVSLLVAAAGIYGVLSYTVQSRVREIGIRAALGASAGSLVSMVVARVGRPVVYGLAAGVAVALLASRTFSDLLFGVAVWDPASVLVTVLLLGSVAGLAAWWPARRAASVDPRSALQGE